MTKKRPPPRLPRLLLDELEGEVWRLELGAKHWLLRIEDTLIAILPLGRMSESPNRNVLAVRSAIRKFKESRK